MKWIISLCLICLIILTGVIYSQRIDNEEKAYGKRTTTIIKDWYVDQEFRMFYGITSEGFDDLVPRFVGVNFVGEPVTPKKIQRGELKQADFPELRVVEIYTEYYYKSMAGYDSCKTDYIQHVYKRGQLTQSRPQSLSGFTFKEVKQKLPGVVER